MVNILIIFLDNIAVLKGKRYGCKKDRT